MEETASTTENGSASKRLKTGDGESDQSSDSKIIAKPPVNIENNGSAEGSHHNVFERFKFKKVLKADPARKLAFLHGVFDEDDGKNAVVILEKTAFELDKFDNLFGGDSKGVREFQNDLYHNYRVFFESQFNPVKTTLIYPATQQHLEKYSEQKMRIYDESPEDYRNITLPFLLKEKRFSTKWVDNILDHEKESERIVFEDPDKETGFILLPDLKWDGHNVESLYLVAIVHKRGIHSIRELTGEHLPMLKRIKEEGTAAICEKYRLDPHCIRAFLHYQPTFYHLHIHFTNIKFDAPGRNAEKAHMLTTVISNLEISSDYYSKASIPFIIGEKDPLYLALINKTF